MIDEWAGDMAADLIQFSPLGYLRALVSRYEQGDLLIHSAEDVAAIRSRLPADENSIVDIENRAVGGDEDSSPCVAHSHARADQRSYARQSYSYGVLQHESYCKTHAPKVADATECSLCDRHRLAHRLP